jgi:hypothetical protein
MTGAVPTAIATKPLTLAAPIGPTVIPTGLSSPQTHTPPTTAVAARPAQIQD